MLQETGGSQQDLTEIFLTTPVPNTGKEIQDYVVPRSVDESPTPPTLGDVLLTERQIIVTISTTLRNVLSPEYQALVWNQATESGGLYGKDNKYAIPGLNEGEFFDDERLFKSFDRGRAVREGENLEKRWISQGQVGIDRKLIMDIGKFVCPFDLCNIFGIVECPAYDNDWDEFQNLKAVADWVNPKIVPAWIGLPWDQLNIIQFDHYTDKITQKFVRYNLDPVRVQVVVHRIEEKECHDPLCRAPEYYPVATINAINSNSEYPPYEGTYGGRYAVHEGRKVTPNWNILRAIPSVDVKAKLMLEIFDDDYTLILWGPKYIRK